MYLLNVSYSQSPATVEPHLASHGAWVRKHLGSGSFLAAGPKRSGLGGIILVKSMPRAALQSLLSEDSYVTADVADYEVVEFDCKLAGAALDALRSA